MALAQELGQFGKEWANRNQMLGSTSDGRPIGGYRDSLLLLCSRSLCVRHLLTTHCHY